MKRRATGYTIIEVLIVLATTSLLLTMAAYFLRGQTAETTFQQSMRDLQSKIEITVNGVGNSLFPNSDSYTCSLVAGADGVKRATLALGSPGNKGSNEQCLYLGRALAVAKGTSTLYIYSVLGGKTYDSGGKTYDSLTFAQTNPEPAIASDTDLTETYKPATGNIELVSAHYDGSNVLETDMAGFYNDMAGSNAERQRLLNKAYPITVNPSNPKNGLATCIEEKTCTPFLPTHWKLCFQDNSKQRTALLDIAPSEDRIVTKLDYTPCT